MLDIVKQMLTMCRYQGDIEELQLIECAPMPENVRQSAEYSARKKECFRNSLLLAAALGEAVKYCVGYAFPAGVPIPIEHAWIEVESVAYDPTWELFSDIGLGYVAVAQMPIAEAMDIMEMYGGNYAPTLYEILNKERQRERCA